MSALDEMKAVAAREVEAARARGLYNITWNTLAQAEAYRAINGHSVNDTRRAKVLDLAARTENGTCISHVQKTLGYSYELSKKVIATLKAAGKLQPIETQYGVRYVPASVPTFKTCRKGGGQ